MTDDKDRRIAAKELAEQLFTVDRSPVPSTGQPNGWDEEWVTLIISALAASERAVWLEAVRIAEAMPIFGGEQKRLMATMIQVCIQQAEKVKP